MDIIADCGGGGKQRGVARGEELHGQHIPSKNLSPSSIVIHSMRVSGFFSDLKSTISTLSPSPRIRSTVPYKI